MGIKSIPHWWGQKVLPLVYENSLSYEEQIDKLIFKINEVIDTFNKYEEIILELQDLSVDLSQMKTDISNLQEAVKGLVVQGLLNVEMDNGYAFSITDAGSKYIRKLKSEYALQYKAIAADAIKRFKDYSDLQLDHMINDSAVKSVRGGR